MKRTDALFLVGLVLLVAGVAVLIYGIVAYNNANASIGNTLGKLLTGRSQAENQAVIEMIAGGAAAVIGVAVLLLRGRRARR
jgi:cell shape-determining protein MreC